MWKLKRLKYNPHLKGKNNCVGGFASNIQIMLFLMITKKKKKCLWNYINGSKCIGLG